jgi:hypothetical protein
MSSCVHVDLRPLIFCGITSTDGISHSFEIQRTETDIKRETEAESETDRETGQNSRDRQTDREGETEIDRQRERQAQFLCLSPPLCLLLRGIRHHKALFCEAS